MLPPYYGSKNMPSNKPEGSKLCLFFDPEDGGDIFIRKVGSYSADYTAFGPGREKSSL
jgi:hypothetical protein